MDGCIDKNIVRLQYGTASLHATTCYKCQQSEIAINLIQPEQLMHVSQRKAKYKTNPFT